MFLHYLIGIGKTLTINFKQFWKFIEINIQKLAQINDPQFVGLFEQMNMAESYRYSMTIVFAFLMVVIYCWYTGSVNGVNGPKKNRGTVQERDGFFFFLSTFIKFFPFPVTIRVIFSAAKCRIFFFMDYFPAGFTWFNRFIFNVDKFI